MLVLLILTLAVWQAVARRVEELREGYEAAGTTRAQVTARDAIIDELQEKVRQ